jgi:hypothetical protein
MLSTAKVNAALNYGSVLMSLVMCLVSLVALISPETVMSRVVVAGSYKDGGVVGAAGFVKEQHREVMRAMAKENAGKIRMYAGVSAVVFGLNAYLALSSGRCNLKC